jgi:hypothetical protein
MSTLSKEDIEKTITCLDNVVKAMWRENRPKESINKVRNMINLLKEELKDLI